MKEISSIILFLSFYANVIAQVENYEVGEIIKWESFMLLSSMDKDRIATEEKHYKRIDQLYSTDSMFIAGTPDSVKAEYYETRIKGRKKFQFNRSKWEVETYMDNKRTDSTVYENEYISTECNCILEDGEIQIFMGWWVFGGTFVNINLEEDKYTAKYKLDAHKLTPYKYSLLDSTLVSELVLDIYKSKLRLLNNPKFRLNEQIQGMIEFETPIYYTESLYNEGMAGGKGERMDIMRDEGRIYFTCELKENPNY